MRIEQWGMNADQKRRAAAELDATEQSVVSANPVCGAHCPKGSPYNCSPFCPQIPQMLSSDPVNHPLEKNIAPLVYEIKRMGVFSPCWSCEGHNDTRGQLWKRPAVWFYARSVLHVRLMADAVKSMRMEKLLNAEWCVKLSHSDQSNADTAFSLEPVAEDKPVRLAALHEDIHAMACALEMRLKTACNALRRALH